MSNTNSQTILAKTILNAINRKLSDDIYGDPLPAIVKKYNIENDTVDIQIAINLYDSDGGYQKDIIIYEIPIIRFSSKTASFKIKIKEGDDGLFLCSSRGLQDWFNKTLKTGITENEDIKARWGIQNSFFFPSLFINKPAEVNILKNINDSILEIKNTIDNIISTIDTLTNAMINVGPANQPAPFMPQTITQLNTNKSQLTLNKANLNNLIIEAQKTYDT